MGESIKPLSPSVIVTSKRYIIQYNKITQKKKRAKEPCRLAGDAYFHCLQSPSVNIQFQREQIVKTLLTNLEKQVCLAIQ